MHSDAVLQLTVVKAPHLVV